MLEKDIGPRRLGNNQLVSNKFCKRGAPAIIQLNPTITLMENAQEGPPKSEHVDVVPE